MTDIKPCPFCGDKGDMNREHCPDGGGVFLSIKCQQCRAKSGEKYHSNGNDCPQTYQEVRDAWNTRADATKDAEIERLNGMMEWQPIETAPKDGFHLQLYRPEIQFVGYWADAGWCMQGCKVIDPAPTHWMFLPPDPAGGMPVESTK